MASEALRKVKDLLDEKVKDKKEAAKEQEQLGWFSLLLDAATDRFVDAVSKLKIKAPEVTVNVPEVKVPDVIVPEIKVPAIPEVKIPEIKIPEIRIPEIHVPKAEVEVKIPELPTPNVTVNVPDFPDIPDLKWPETEMPIRGWVQLMGVDLAHPLPVELRDSNGKPVDLSGGGAVSGGIAKVVQSKLLDGAGNKITSTSGALDVNVAYGATVTVQVQDIQIGAVELKDSTTDNRAAVSATGVLSVDGSSVTQPVSAASTLDVRQVSGASWSVEATVPATLTVNQVSGASWSVEATVPATLDVRQVSGASWSVEATVPSTLDVRQVSGASWSVEATIPATLDVRQVSGASWSVEATVPSTLIVNQVSGASWSVSAQGLSFLNVTATTSSTVVKASAGVLHTIIINKRGTGSLCDVYGDLVGEGSKIASIDTTLSVTALLYDIAFTSGLTVVTSGTAAADVTISYI